jgi:lysozyme
MAYIDTNSRSTKVLSNEALTPLGRQPVLHGLFIGFVKDTADIQRNGRLRVWIPELGSAPTEAENWMTVSYCSPFAGATSVSSISKSNLEQFEGTQTSYGMWMVPPDIDNQVLVMFINGNPANGVWIGCLYNQFMNNMVPGMASDINSHQYPGKPVPLAEYNKWDTKVTQPDRAFKPYEKTKFKGLGNQGLITDASRGITSSSARRESPSTVFGILTPGPVIDENAAPTNIRRKGGSSFIMDDGVGSEYVQLTTKSGAQVKLDETNGFVYLINRDGTAWVQMDQKGNIDIFGAQNISMRAQYDVNIRADRNINLEAGQNIYMKAAQDTQKSKTSFTYDVNNVPKPVTDLDYYKYVGEGKGEGGNIVMQALNNWHSTTKNTAYLTVVQNDMNIDIGNAFKLTTLAGGQDYNSKQGIKMTTDGAFDFAATGNIRVGTNGSLSVVSQADTTVCSNANISLKAQGNINEVAAGNILVMGSTFGVTAPSSFSGIMDIVGLAKIGGGLTAAGPVALGGVVPVTPPTQPNPPNAEPATSAARAPQAEVKPTNNKINILATWSDTQDKFKRNSEPLLTTLTRLATYEPCPEHETFNLSNIAGFKPNLNEADKTYAGSSGSGNSQTSAPPASTVPGTNNTSVPGDSAKSNDYSKDVNVNALRCELTIHEGLKTKSYKDSLGLLTGGIGHLLRSNEISDFPEGTPISSEQIESWYTQDVGSSIKCAQDLMGDSWSNLSDIRKRAVCDLAYNLGKSRLSLFVQFLTAMRAGSYDIAGEELRNSKWFTQVGRRGPNIITMVVQDIDPNRCDQKFPN